MGNTSANKSSELPIGIYKDWGPNETEYLEALSIMRELQLASQREGGAKETFNAMVLKLLL